MSTVNTNKEKFNIQKTFNRLIIVVSIGVLAHLVFLLITNDRNIFQYLHQIKLPYLLLIAICLSGFWIGHALRLMIWTRYIKQPLSFKTGLRIAIFTELGAAITPTLIGGGPIKLGLMIKEGISAGKAGFLTLLSGFEDFIMYTLVFIVALVHARESVYKIFEAIYNFVSNQWMYIVGVMVALVIIRWVLVKSNVRLNIVPIKYQRLWVKFKQGLGAAWQEMLESFNQVRKDGLLYFMLSFCIMLFQWFSRFSVLVILLYALGVDFKLFHVYIQQWIVYLTMIFIPTPGATGGAEASFFLLFENTIPKDLLPLIVSTWRFFIYYFMLFMAVVIIQWLQWSKNKNPKII